MNRSRPIWISVMMLVLSILYLIPETIFNSHLVAVAGGRESTEADLRVIEYFGRTVSGVGATLLIADLLLKGRIAFSKVRLLFFFILAALLVWPTVFFGQKWLVDHFIVDKTTPQERQYAYLTQILRSGLIANAVVIDDVPYDPDTSHSPAEQTFLALFGGIIYADKRLLASLEDKQEEIISKFVRKSANDDFEDYYLRYGVLRADIRSQFQDYQAWVKEYDRVLETRTERAKSLWNKVNKEVDAGWEGYQQASDDTLKVARKRAQTLGPKVYDYFSRLKRCSSAACSNRLKNRYDAIIQKVGIGYIEPEYWLIREEISAGQNILNSVILGALTGGASVLMQGVDKASGGDGGFKDARYSFTNDTAHYEKLILLKMAPGFEKKSGFPLGIASKRDYLNHEGTSKRVINTMKKEGLNLPSGWTLSNRAAFNRAVYSLVERNARSKWDRDITARGMSLTPDLGWNGFQRSDDIQSLIREKMGERFYVKPMLADWNNEQFYRKVVEPNIRRKTEEILRNLKAHEVNFADGGQLEEIGKSAVRAAVIPPISMSLSLFLVLVTVLKLPKKGYDLYKDMHAGTKDSNYINLFRVGGAVLPIVLIIAVPLAWVDSKYTARNSAVNHLLVNIEEQMSPAAAGVLTWLIHTQPLVQPAGEWMEGLVGLSEVFDVQSGNFARIDQFVFTGRVSNEKNEKETVSAEKPSGRVPLVVETTPKHARIQVMNIKPVYQPGMLLPIGAYRLRVSAEGYATAERTVLLTPESRTFSINLKPQLGKLN